MTQSDITCDVLVIGSGIAGLFVALDIAKTKSVCVVTKKDSAESNTNYAQGGIAAVFSENDSFENHIADTLHTGLGLSDPEAVRMMVEQAPSLVEELITLGAEFTRQASKLDLGLEGGHSHARIVHRADSTGREIERALVQAVFSHPNVRVLEHHSAVELITAHHAENRVVSELPVQCYGAYVLCNESRSIIRVFAGSTVLATGGCGQVYEHTTNPVIATGDGLAMACRAGAEVSNMEFIQFHPTTLFHPNDRSFLISEAVRGFGGILRTIEGHRFMGDYDARMELAPRDVVARAIDLELKRSGASHVLLDITHKSAQDIQEHFPAIYERCRKNGIDITVQPIPVVPAAHYCCGGVTTDLNGATNIENLYAIGEVACHGIHGANRLASNSLLEGLVFARRAALAINAKEGMSRTSAALHEKIRPWDSSGTTNIEEWVVIASDRREIQRIMWDYVGIVRSRFRLKRAKRRLRVLASEIETFYKKTVVSEELLELRNIATVARLIVKSALSRKESRGLHTLIDYPETNPKFAESTRIRPKQKHTYLR